MTQIKGFTRKEAMQLTGCTSSRLAYLEKVGLIVPYRYGVNGGKPVVIFSWEQLLGIRSIRDLRLEDVPVQTVKKFIDFLEKSECSDNLRNKILIFMNDEVFFVSQDWSDFGDNMPRTLKKASQGNKAIQWYTLIAISLKNTIKEIWAIAENSKSINFQDFQQRAGKFSQHGG